MQWQWCPTLFTGSMYTFSMHASCPYCYLHHIHYWIRTRWCRHSLWRAIYSVSYEVQFTDEVSLDSALSLISCNADKRIFLLCIWEIISFGSYVYIRLSWQGFCYFLFSKTKYFFLLLWFLSNLFLREFNVWTTRVKILVMCYYLYTARNRHFNFVVLRFDGK